MKNKKYVLPTNDWLVPLKELTNDDISTSGILILSKLLNKEKVIVKISFNKTNKIDVINNILMEIPSFNASYCTFQCYENSMILDSKYADAKGLCNGKKSDDMIFVEVMKKYKHSLTPLVNTYDDIILLKPLLQQLLCAQLVAFKKYGFIHNDIHLGNILFDDKPFNYIYNLEPNNYKKININSPTTVVLTDFDKSQLLNPKYRKLYNSDYPNVKYYDIFATMPYNIFKTFKNILSLYKHGNEVMYEIDNIKINGRNELEYSNIDYNKSQRSLVKYDRIDFEDFIAQTITNCYNLCNFYFTLLFNESFIDVVD